MGITPPTPQFMESLRQLTSGADSDESPTVARSTDPGIQLPTHDRKTSMLSVGDYSAGVFFEVPKLASPQLSAATTSRVVRPGRVSRQSPVASEAADAAAAAEVVGSFPGAGHRAGFRLGYQFGTSSARAAVQRQGQRSLSALEELARVGQAEQGTNFKRSYVSLYSPMHPLFQTMKVFGVFHTRQKGGRQAHKFTNSYVYSGLVLLAAWFNVLRFFFAYDWGAEKFDSLMFFKLTQHATLIQTAVATSVMFKASGKLPRFFKACHEFMGKRHNLTYRFALGRRTRAAVALGCLVMLTELAVYLSWVVRADSEYLCIFLRPYTLLVNWTDISRIVLTVMAFPFNVYSAAAWVFPALLFCNFAWIFEREFRFLEHRLCLACTNERVFVGDIEKFRSESWRISKLVSKLDEVFNFYVFVLFLTDVLSVCLIMYNLLIGQYPDDGSTILAWFWLLSALLRLFGVTISAAKVNQAACSPLGVIQNMNLRDYTVNPAKIGQLMIFLNKLTLGNIGFSAWNLFTLSRTSALTIAALILTYFLLFVKVGASYWQDDRLRTTRHTVTTLLSNTTSASVW